MLRMTSVARRCGRALLPLLLVLAVSIPAALAQTGDQGAGAGRDPNEPVPPGLTQIPGTAPASKDEVQLYIPHQDQLIGRVSIPDAKLATLVQPEGRDWRAFRRGAMMWIIGGLAVIMVVGLAAFYLLRGKIRIERGWSGRWVPRFNTLDRFAHWSTAISFLILALSGLIITFGRPVLIPLVGHNVFTPIADAAKYLHNFSSVPFVVGILLMLVLWVKDNIPERADIAWIKSAGGLLKGHSEHPEAGRFNAGQKGIFWTVVLGGIVMAVTGYLLMTPFYYTGVSGMQIAHVIHAILAGLLIAMIIAHIYIGTLGMEGAFDAMGRGVVDENWAIEHHKGWYDRMRQKGKVTSEPGPTNRDLGGQRVGAD